MAAPLPGVAVNCQRAQVTLAAPAAVAVAELGPNAWARVRTRSGVDGGGEGDGEGDGESGSEGDGDGDAEGEGAAGSKGNATWRQLPTCLVSASTASACLTAFMPPGVRR